MQYSLQVPLVLGVSRLRPQRMGRPARLVRGTGCNGSAPAGAGGDCTADATGASDMRRQKGGKDGGVVGGALSRLKGSEGRFGRGGALGGNNAGAVAGAAKKCPSERGGLRETAWVQELLQSPPRAWKKLTIEPSNTERDGCVTEFKFFCRVTDFNAVC